MYASFFAFRELPFNNTPDPRFFYSTPDHEEAVASLVYAVKERKGFVLLTGEVGAGKTLVTRMVLRQLGTQIAFANLHHAIHSPQELMESICTEFELPLSPDGAGAQLVRTLHDFLLSQFARNTPVVLVLDEAQNLPVETFEQLRMIGNLEADDAKLLQIAIVGQPELQQLFQSPALRQLRQRLFRSFHLPALSREHTDAYVRHRLHVAAERDLDIFDGDAMAAIYRASNGLPRLINTVCDNALLSAYSSARLTIDGPFMESVLAQLMLEEVGVAGSRRPIAYSSVHPQRATPAVERSSTPPTTASMGRATPTRGAPRANTPGAPTAVAPSHAPRDDVQHSVERSHLAIRQEILRIVGELSARLDAVERRPAVTTGGTTDARTVYAALGPLAEQTRGLIGRAEAVSRDLNGREERLQTLAAALTSVTKQLRALLDRAQGTASSISVAERQARAGHDRLLAQTHRSRLLVEDMVRMKDAMGAATRVPPSLSATIDRAPDRHGAGEPASARSVGAGPGVDGLRDVLLNTRDSLSELRDLARVERASGEATTRTLDDLPTARLANRVADLLGSVVRASAAGGDRVAAAS